MYYRFLHVFYIIHSAVSLNVSEYLQRYGYLDTSEISSTNIENGLIKFQEFYDLPIDGTPNNETLKFMDRPRCGLSDFPQEIQSYANKWTKREILWYFAMGSPPAINIAEEAFDMWQNYTNLTFTYSVKTPDIVISFADKVYRHGNNKRCMKGECFLNFDGRGNALAHAFFPSGNRCIEIHLDKSENWYYERNSTPSGETSLIKVLLHEIGHTLGLKHSADSASIMYAFCGEDVNSYPTVILNRFSNCMARERETSTLPNSTTITSTNASAHGGDDDDDDEPNLCEIHPNSFLITSSHHMYIFYKEWVWIMNIRDKMLYRKAEKIRDYLPEIPTPFTHIYQNSDDFIIIFSGNSIYKVEFPSFKLIQAYGITTAGITSNRKINSAFNTYRGKAYIFYDNYYYVEIDERNLGLKARGLISDKFPAIPPNINYAFRYINGDLFFLKNHTFYQFNEFTNKLVLAREFDLQMFGIQSSTKTKLLEKIQELLKQL